MICEKCGTELQVGDFPFCKRGPSDHTRGFAAVHGDECDFISHNGEKNPIRFRSRAEHRRWLKEKGYVIKDEHRPAPGTDKSKHTTNWAAQYDEYTARNVKLLLERAFNQKPDEPEAPMNIRTFGGDFESGVRYDDAS